MATLPVLYDYPLAYNPAKPRLLLIEKGVPYTSKASKLWLISLVVACTVVVQFINLFNGQSLSPAYLRLNPHGTSPTLIVGDKTLTESLECILYVDEHLGGPPLGGDKVDRAFVEQWVKEVDKWNGNIFMAAYGGDQVKSILGKLTQYKERYAKARVVKHSKLAPACLDEYAQARMKENPDLAPLYKEKIEAMAAGIKAIGDQAVVDKNDKVLDELLDTAESRLKASGAEGWLAGPAYSLADVLLTVLLVRVEMNKLQARFIEPRPALNSFYKRVRQRPSWNQAFGSALSGLTGPKLFFPALAKAWVANLTGWY
ncbi:hypothetical protein N2152v2_000871 [Parachlorella kessleri]